MNLTLDPLRRWFTMAGLAGGLAIVLVGCDRAPTSVRRPKKDKDKVQGAVIDKAYEEARRTVPEFIVELGTMRADYRYLVKMRVEAEGDIEYVWIEPAHYQNGMFFGPVANDPVSIASVKKGEVVRASVQEIYDWVILDQSDKLVAGGFTKKAAEPPRPKRAP